MGALAEDATLTHVSLRNNPIHTAGARAIACGANISTDR